MRDKRNWGGFIEASWKAQENCVFGLKWVAERAEEPHRTAMAVWLQSKGEKCKFLAIWNIRNDILLSMPLKSHRMD